MEVLVLPLHRTIRVKAGANLLEALRAAQIPMSYSCTAGRCGTCRCKVIDGDVLDGGQEHQRPLEAGDDSVLACQTYVTGPCTIEIPEPKDVVVHPARILRAEVTALDNVAHDVKRLRLKPVKPLMFSPGQYVELQFKAGHSRPYSIAGLPEDGQMEFYVRVVANGRVSGYIANTLRPGDRVRVTGPLGAGYLRRNHTGPMLCVAGGTGLAPILSIVRGAVAQGMLNPIRVYVGVRSPRDLYGLEQFAPLQRKHPAINVNVVVMSGGDPRVHRCGLVTDAIERDVAEMSDWRAYLCGSPPMVEATTLLARRLGIPSERIHAEAFYPQGI